MTQSDFLRRIALTLAALAAYRAGGWIPLPGVDAGALAGQAGMVGTIDRISIMALGIIPLLSALVLIEAALIVVPGARSWAADDSNRKRLDGWIAVGALALAGLQAAGIASALEGTDGLVREPGLGFSAGVVLSLVAGTALAMWLASFITRYGVGLGFWIMVAAPHAISFVQALLVQAALWGPASPVTIALSVGYLALCTAVLATITRTSPALAAPDELLWAPVLGFAVANWLLAGLLLLRWLVLPAGQTGEFDQFIISEGATVAPLVAIALVVILRRRSFGLRSRFDKASAVYVALALAGLVIAGNLLSAMAAHPLFPSAATALILSTVGIAIASSRWRSDSAQPLAEDSQIPPANPI